MDIDRIRRGTPSTLSVTFYGDEEPLTADSAVSVSVVNANGLEIATGPATLTDGAYEFVLPPQSNLSVLTVSWSGDFAGQPTTVETFAEVVGGEYFSLAELRAADSVLSNTTRYPTAKLANARTAVEAEFEGICGRAFVPRYASERLVSDGSGALWLSNPEPLRVISCTVNDEDWSGRMFGGAEDNLRVITLSDGVFPRDGRITIEYEYGKAYVPIRIKNAALKRAKYSLVASQSRIDERATTMNIPDFGNFVLATPGMRGSYTGIPEVDVVLADYVLA